MNHPRPWLDVPPDDDDLYDHTALDGCAGLLITLLLVAAAVVIGGGVWLWLW